MPDVDEAPNESDQRERELLARELERLDADERKLHRTSASWAAAAEDAAETLRKLERPGFTALFRWLAGDRRERIADHRALLHRAREKHSESAAGLAELQAERQRILVRLGAMQAAADSRRGPPGSTERDAAGQPREGLRAPAEIVAPLVEMARTALGHFEIARDELSHARRWGRFDMMGGGLFFTWWKHRYLDRAGNEIAVAQRLLDDVRRRLQIVQYASVSSAIDVSTLLANCDWFLDGLLVDWIVQRRIVHAIERVGASIARTRDFVLELERRAAGDRR